MLSYTIIYNPASGHAKPDCRRTAQGPNLKIASGKSPWHRPKVLMTPEIFAYQAQSDIVVAVGGDGTINQVVAGLAPRKQPPTLAILPEGTGQQPG